MKHFEKFAYPEKPREKTYAIDRHTTIEKPYPIYAADLIPPMEEEYGTDITFKCNTAPPLFNGFPAGIIVFTRDEESHATTKPKKNSRRTPAKSSKRSHKI